MNGIFHWNEGIIHEGGVIGNKAGNVTGTLTFRLNNLENLTSGTNFRLDTVTTNQDTQITRLTEIRDYVDTLETKFQQMLNDLATYEAARNADQDLLNTRIGEVQANPTANTLLDRVLQVKNAIDTLNTNTGTYEGNRNTDADLANTRLTEVRDYLDTVETQLATMITNLGTYETNRNTDQDLANTRLTEVRDYLDTVETQLATMITNLATYETNRNTDQDLMNTRLGNADQTGLGAGSSGVMGFVKELWGVGVAGGTNSGLKIVFNGTPVTGATMPAGGFGGTGWLSAIWKNQDVATTDSTNWALKKILEYQKPKTSGILNFTTGNFSFSALENFNYVTIYTYPIPGGQIFVPTYMSMMCGAIGYSVRMVERTELATIQSNGTTGIFTDGAAASESTEFWTDVQIDTSTAFAGGTDPFTMNITYLNENNVSRTVATSVRRGRVERTKMTLFAGDLGVRDITNITITGGAQTNGFSTIVGLKEVAVLSSTANDIYNHTYPERMALKGGRKMCLEGTAGGAAAQTMRATATGYLTTEI